MVFLALGAQSCEHRGGRNDLMQNAAVEHPEVNPAAWHKQHAGLGSLQQKKVLGMRLKEAPGLETGAGRSKHRSCAGWSLFAPNDICFLRFFVLKAQKCHFPFFSFLLFPSFSSSFAFSVSFPLWPWLQRLFNPQ